MADGVLSPERVAHFNLILTQAIFEALEAKGLLAKEEVSERLKKMKEWSDTESRIRSTSGSSSALSLLHILISLGVPSSP